MCNIGIRQNIFLNTHNLQSIEFFVSLLWYVSTIVVDCTEELFDNPFLFRNLNVSRRIFNYRSVYFTSDNRRVEWQYRSVCMKTMDR